MSTEPVRVLVVDDQALMRRGLARLLAAEDGIEVMGEAAHGEEALALLAGLPEEERPHVALVDVRMPVMDGITLIRRLGEDHPAVATVILTTFQEDQYLFEGLRAGARGYLLKDAEPDEVADVLRRAARGERVLTGAIADRLVGALDAAPVPGPPSPAAGPLSERETQVAQLISEGAANREIAERLFVTEGTVRNHVTNALRKLDLHDRTQLALWFSRERG